LRWLVERSEGPVRLKYVGKGKEEEEEVMLSPAAQLVDDGKVKEVGVKVLTPSFCSGFVRYADAMEAFFEESGDGGKVEISGLGILVSLSLTASPTREMEMTFLEKVTFDLVSRLRKKSAAAIAALESKVIDVTEGNRSTGNGFSSLDSFVLTTCTPDERKSYTNTVLQLLMADRIAFGWPEILSLEIFILKVVIMWWVTAWLEPL